MYVGRLENIRVLNIERWGFRVLVFSNNDKLVIRYIALLKIIKIVGLNIKNIFLKIINKLVKK